MMAKLRYTCAALPPEGISITAVYDFGKDKEGFYIQKSSDAKLHMGLELIKMLFTPVEKTWAEVLKEPVIVKK